MKEGYLLTKKEAADLFIILSQARLKLTGKYQTSAKKYWEMFELELLKEYTFEERDEISKRD